jgi:hypothetical protein
MIFKYSLIHLFVAMLRDRVIFESLKSERWKAELRMFCVAENGLKI